MVDTRTVRYEQEIPDVMNSMASVHETMDAYGLDRRIHHLVQLRASQINGCGFCVKMHTKEARQDGETNERLDRVIVWDHVDDFSEREQAALAWTEALTTLDPKAELGALRARLREHFIDDDDPAIDDNPNIEDYMGRIQLGAAYRGDRHSFAIGLKNNLDSENRSGVELNWMFPLGDRLRGFVQVYSGYGESMIDMENYVNRVGVGISLNDWL